MELVDAHLNTLLKRAIAIIEADRKLAEKLAEQLVSERILSDDDIASALDASVPSQRPKRRSHNPGRRESPGDGVVTRPA